MQLRIAFSAKPTNDQQKAKLDEILLAVAAIADDPGLSEQVRHSTTRRGAAMIQSALFSKSLNKDINTVLLRRNPPHMSGFKESVY